MDVILLNDVEKLGLRGDVVHVADGYARNFLLPRRLAERATPAKVKELERREAERARHEARTAEQAQSIADTLGKTVLRFEVQAGPTGTLFGSVTPTNVADEIWRTRKIRVDRRKIALEEPIKRIGRYAVPIHVFEGVEVEVKTLVVPEGGELPPEEELAAMEAAEREAEAAEAEGAPVEQAPMEAVESVEADATEAEEAATDADAPAPGGSDAAQSAVDRLFAGADAGDATAGPADAAPDERPA
jgi:large subunit ribosomal protein L9